MDISKAPQTVPIERVTLDRLRYRMKRTIALSHLPKFSVNTLVDQQTEDLVIQVTAEVFGREVLGMKPDEIRYPATWVDGMLDAIYKGYARTRPGRWLRRWPVRWEDHHPCLVVHKMPSLTWTEP